MTLDFSSSTPGPDIGAAITHQTTPSSLSYHEDGAQLFVATPEDSRLHVINCQTGKSEGPALRCERDGVSIVSRTHHNQCVLVTGDKGSSSSSTNQFIVQYISMYDQKILRKFRGHSDVITNISLCPADDSFLTSSKDRTVRLWNAEKAGCLAKMDLPPEATGTPYAVYDFTGLVFAIMAAMANDRGGYYVHLYDAQNSSVGAFAELKIKSTDIQKAMQMYQIPPSDQLEPDTWESLSFNCSGNRFIVVTAQGRVIVMDGYDGSIQRVFDDATAATFSPDDRTLLIGTPGGTVRCYDAATWMLVNTLSGLQGPVTAIACNPKYSQIATACTNHTCLWIW